MLENDYYFMQSISSNSYSLAIASNYESQPQLLYQTDLKSIVGETFDPNGLSGIFYSSNQQIFYYLRSDMDGIRLFTIDLEDWHLLI